MVITMAKLRMAHASRLGQQIVSHLVIAVLFNSLSYIILPILLKLYCILLFSAYIINSLAYPIDKLLNYIETILNIS